MGEGEPAGRAGVESEEEVSLLDQALDRYAALMEGGASVTEEELEAARKEIIILTHDDVELKRAAAKDEYMAHQGVTSEVRENDEAAIQEQRWSGQVKTGDQATREVIAGAVEYDKELEYGKREEREKVAKEIARLAQAISDVDFEIYEEASEQAGDGEEATFSPEAQAILDRTEEIMAEVNDVRMMLKLDLIHKNTDATDFNPDTAAPDYLEDSDAYINTNIQTLQRAEQKLKSVWDALTKPWKEMKDLRKENS